MSSNFQSTVWEYYNQHRRSMPWREHTDPYLILVSELMLQQTQVSRVIPKFEEFVRAFPNIHTLANAQLSEVLKLWSGLGYNRRARFLHEAAQKIVHTYDGIVPEDTSLLVKLPGIGPHTAGAICAYAFNKPAVFIETNIRAVYLHHFFQDRTQVPDTELLPFIAETLDTKNPREWYWALMDYGAYLKSSLPNPSRASRHHSKQSRFEGSRRQLRGQILKALTRQPMSKSQLEELFPRPELESVLTDLHTEKLLHIDGDVVYI